MAAWKVALVLFLCCLHCAWSVSPPDGSNERNKRSDDSAPLQAVVDTMAQRLNAFEAKINAQQAQIAAQQAQIDSLERVVAFQAFGGQSPVSALAHGTMIASHVTLNIGNAYDPKSGFFTTPVSGLYQFHAGFMDYDHADGVWAGIFVGDSQVAYGISDTRTGYWDTTVMAATVHVTQGQVVQLRNDNNAVVDLHGGLHLSFSGFLIQAD